MNPIMQLLNRGNNQPQAQQPNNLNMQFAQFLRANEGKGAEQIARENNIDFNLVNNLWQMLKK